MHPRHIPQTGRDSRSYMSDSELINSKNEVRDMLRKKATKERGEFYISVRKPHLNIEVWSCRIIKGNRKKHSIFMNQEELPYALITK